MYLEHFGLNEPPFKITPITEFFFSGANRGEILNALIYAITDREGIIKISGEVGSGKTMLCRMLLNRLPTNIKAIYLANPSLSRDELLYAIADGLELDVEGQRVSLLMQNLHNHLVTKYNQGEHCVVLVDEAHAMPLDTLEELRLLYNLQIGKHKLIQIVLFGQPELDKKLEQNNMRQLKDRIVHNFTMQPISRKVIESYLMFRMRAAGYHGPDIFSPAAISLISKASNGMMRRVNILADKSLLAAFVENTHNIEPRHVHAAIRDSEISPDEPWFNRKRMAITAGITLSALALTGAGWLLGRSNSTQRVQENAPSIAATQPLLAASSAAISPTAIAPQAQSSPAVAVMSSAAAAAPTIAKTPSEQTATQASVNEEDKDRRLTGSLLQQRLAATKEMLAHVDKNNISIQLFYTQDAKPTRMEGFLSRAKNLGKLSEIYIVQIKINGKDAYRVLYGIYPDSEAARIGMKNLPKRYIDAFAPTLNSLNSY